MPLIFRGSRAPDVQRNFTRDLELWVEPHISPTAYAVEANHLIDGDSPSTNTLDFVKKCFESTSAQYTYSPGKPASKDLWLSFTRSAIAVARIGHKGKRPPRNIIRKRLDLSKTDIDALREHALQALVEFVHPKRPPAPIENVYLALSILWQLDDEKQPDFKERLAKTYSELNGETLQKSVSYYLYRCFGDTDNGHYAFKLDPRRIDPQECLSACFFANRIAEQVNIQKQFSSIWADDILPYIQDSWTDSGGFRVSPESTDSSTILHTYFALDLEKRAYKGKAFERIPGYGPRKITSFIRSCLCTDGGFAFTPNADENRGNMFASLTVSRIYKEFLGGQIPKDIQASILRFTKQLEETPDSEYPGAYRGIIDQHIQPTKKVTEAYRQSQLQYFLSRLDELLADETYSGKFIAIRDEEIIDHSNNESELFERCPGEDILLFHVVGDSPLIRTPVALPH